MVYPNNMDTKDFNRYVKKIHGFTPTPLANISGSYKIYPMKIVAAVKCNDCGEKFTITLNGRTERVSSVFIEKKIRDTAIARHPCNAIKDMIEHNKRDHFNDIYRGMETINNEKSKIVGRS